jgi:hypothetical protein
MIRRRPRALSAKDESRPNSSADAIVEALHLQASEGSSNERRWLDFGYAEHVTQKIRDHRLAMLGGGWQPIAVHAPWSPYAHSPGKQPVKRWGETPAERDWRRGHTEAQLVHVNAVSSNTGTLCDGLRDFDLDIDDPAISTAVKAILVPFLPAGGLVRQRQGSPRIAKILRAEARPGKLSVGGAQGKVEILGVGQQVLVHGAHPSGGCWFFDGPAPWDIPIADLPTISESVVSEALQAIAASGLLGPSIANRRANGGGKSFRPIWSGSEVAALRARIVASGGSIRNGVTAFLADVVEGHRHNSLVTTAGLLIECGWPADRACTLMLDAASAWDGTNWPYDVDKAVAHSLANQAKRKTR